MVGRLPRVHRRVRTRFPGPYRASANAPFLLVVQSLSALCLVWLYPNFLVTALLVVVSWQIAWSTTLRNALAAVLAQSVALAAMKCVDQADGMSLLVLMSTCGFELFAVSAAHLARSEASAQTKPRHGECRVAGHARVVGGKRPHGRTPADLTRPARRARSPPHEPGRPPRCREPNRTGNRRRARSLRARNRGNAASRSAGVVSQVRVQPLALRATLLSLTANCRGCASISRCSRRAERAGSARGPMRSFAAFRS